MQKRAGLLYLAKSTGRMLLILENEKWTIPTFERKDSLLNDASLIFEKFVIGKIIPIELYQSTDSGFEYGTYVCLVDAEFLLPDPLLTFCWASIDYLPKNIHTGFKSTINNQNNKVKISTVLEIFKD
jgi:hypothetical protein